MLNQLFRVYSCLVSVIYIISIIAFSLMSAPNKPMELYDFNVDCDLSNWYVLDDGVMGGRSAGNLRVNEEGNGLFYGEVSLENNGGFSSIRHNFSQRDIAGYSLCKVLLKGDGKKYQFRVKTGPYDRHSYIYHFETSGEWETITIPLEELYPAFRGRTLDMPNYPAKLLAELSFLISNKKAESFKLELDKITLE